MNYIRRPKADRRGTASAVRGNPSPVPHRGSRAAAGVKGRSPPPATRNGSQFGCRFVS
ncbi:MAG: hypothetical protein IJK96_01885 [Bacteroidales bacterium]|nr:hypothetical protein [Bacteroidales bacterium]